MTLSHDSCFHIIEGYVTGGNRADISCADNWVSGCDIIEDKGEDKGYKGYDSNNHRIYWLSHNNIPIIPGRKNSMEIIEYDKDKFKMRHRI